MMSSIPDLTVRIKNTKRELNNELGTTQHGHGQRLPKI